MHNHDDASFQNEGAPDSDLLVHNHDDASFLNEGAPTSYDERKYEHEASKQLR